jgi:glycosyltransferase involved in cell wall biosynthesis
MKILHVVKKYPEALGGDAIVVSNLRTQQKIAGHDTVIVTSNCDEIADGPHIYKFGLKDTAANLDAITPRRIISLVILFFKMFVFLAKERPDVIHTHSVDMAFFVSFAARLYHIPIVHTFHIVTFYDKDQPALRRNTELWLAKNAKARKITAPNVYDVKKLQSAGFWRTALLPNGVDIKFWGAKTAAKKNPPFTFLAIGRLEQQKGYDFLIKAAAQFAKTSKASFIVKIVGEGSQKTTLKTLINQLGAQDIVSLVGRKTPEEIRNLFGEADAAVFPSLYETTPVTMLEAWAASVPVIVTSVGILRDAPVDFGAAYIVKPKDEISLMRAMRRCMNDHDMRLQIATKGRAEAERYDWPLVAETAEQIYLGAL